MTMYARTVCACAIFAGVIAWGADVRVQIPAQIGSAPVVHVGVVVRGIAATVRLYSDVMGVRELQSRDQPA